MKNSILFIVIAVLTFSFSLFMPWWVVAPIAFGVAYFAKLSVGKGFALPFAAVFITWLVSIYVVDTGVVASLVGELFGMPGVAAPFVAAALGAAVAGLFGLAGALLVSPKKDWVNG
jgi:hypothetical protein